MKMFNHGVHGILDVWGGVSKLTPKETEALLVEAAKSAKANILDVAIHEFTGGGCTGVVTLSESHISIHTWPEDNFAAIDLYLCSGEEPLDKAVAFILESSLVEKHKLMKIKRGSK